MCIVPMLAALALSLCASAAHGRAGIPPQSSALGVEARCLALALLDAMPAGT